MKKNILDPGARDEILFRIQILKAGSRGRWGILNAEQMVRHLTQACKMSFDEVVIPDRSNLFTRTLGKWLFLSNVKPIGRERGIIKTFPEIDIVALKVNVSDLDHERSDYAAIIERLVKTEALSNHHTLFGKMSRNDWGLLAYAHADYHLTQFSV